MDNQETGGGSSISTKPEDVSGEGASAEVPTRLENDQRLAKDTEPKSPFDIDPAFVQRGKEELHAILQRQSTPSDSSSPSDIEAEVVESLSKTITTEQTTDDLGRETRKHTEKIVGETGTLAKVRPREGTRRPISLPSGWTSVPAITEAEENWKSRTIVDCIELAEYIIAKLGKRNTSTARALKTDEEAQDQLAAMLYAEQSEELEPKQIVGALLAGFGFSDREIAQVCDVPLPVVVFEWNDNPAYNEISDHAVCAYWKHDMRRVMKELTVFREWMRDDPSAREKLVGLSLRMQEALAKQRELDRAHDLKLKELALREEMVKLQREQTRQGPPKFTVNIANIPPEITQRSIESLSSDDELLGLPDGQLEDEGEES